MAPVTLIYAGILILLSILLANQVLYVRLRGDKEPDWKENTVQGFSLILSKMFLYLYCFFFL